MNAIVLHYLCGRLFIETWAGLVELARLVLSDFNIGRYLVAFFSRNHHGRNALRGIWYAIGVADRKRFSSGMVRPTDLSRARHDSGKTRYYGNVRSLRCCGARVALR